MSGVYIHIPFCKQACNYCDFHFSTNSSIKSEIIRAIQTEIRNRAANWPVQEICSIYFGGGTPSLLTHSELSSILQVIHENFIVEVGAEVTFEANPDDLTKSALEEWKKLGVNRLSIGVQSFSDKILKWMNRAHTAFEARQSLDLALEMGFHSSNIDLIFGVPGLSNRLWEESIDVALNSGIKHLSAYSLTMEPNTLFAHQVKKGISKPLDEGLAKEQFTFLGNRIENEGWEHYEISNYCLPGFRALHNSQYWTRVPYLGIGPSAHSFDGKVRRWNIASNHNYLKKIDSNEKFWEEEVLTRTDRINEHIMLGLRVKEGIDCQRLKHEEQFDVLSDNPNQLNHYLQIGWLINENNRLLLSKEGWHYADRIASDLFV